VTLAALVYSFWVDVLRLRRQAEPVSIPGFEITGSRFRTRNQER
jgi:hypothetical protein